MWDLNPRGLSTTDLAGLPPTRLGQSRPHLPWLRSFSCFGSLFAFSEVEDVILLDDVLEAHLKQFLYFFFVVCGVYFIFVVCG